MKRIAATPATWENEQMFNGLDSVKQLNISVKTIIDVGAAAGTWTLLAKRLWPDCSYLLFEPLTERTNELETLAKQNTNVFIARYAAGDAIGETHFFVADDLDGSGVTNDNPSGNNIRVVQQTTVDHEIKERKLQGPFLVKLDTHGFEIPIIEGCKGIMSDVSVFIIECYGLRIAKDSLLFWEMCRHMDDLGFRLFAIADQMNRPKDGVFWQCDAFFIRNDHEVFKNTSYN